jgi:nitrite reductase/ring-hydroxylating ferredoxin subunit
MAWVSLCEKSELTRGKPKAVDEAGFHLAVYLHAGKVSVLDDTCPHAGASLIGGWVEEAAPGSAAGACAVCPQHGWMFSLESGEMPDAPGVAIRVYPVREKALADGRVLVQAELPLP